MSHTLLPVKFSDVTRWQWPHAT